MKIKDIIEEHAQPNFMIGIGYVKPYCEELESRIEKLREALESVACLHNKKATDKEYWMKGHIEGIAEVVVADTEVARTALREDAELQ